jgi:hypothetical protein
VREEKTMTTKTESLRLVELLNKANEGYEDHGLEEYYDMETGEQKPEGSGDTLAKFVVIEISETFDAEADRDQQIAEAIRVMEAARDDIDNVLRVLERM